MIHRTRVTLWLPILATLLLMLMVSFAASAYYGAIEDDPDAWPLTILAAFSCGAPAWLILYAGWQGITLNVGNCPYTGAPATERWYPEIEPMPSAFESTVTVYRDPAGFNWLVNYPTSTWHAAAKVMGNNRGKIPQRQAAVEGI